MTSKYRHFKDAIYEQFARIGKAVSTPHRLELLDLLSQGPQTVEVLAKKAGLSVANTSQHLRLLCNARLVEGSREGRFVTYRIADKAVNDYLAQMRTLAEKRLAEVEQITQRFLEGREGLDPIDRNALLEHVRKGLVTVLDVRPTDEYSSAHIPGAISIPLKELEAHLSELPRDQEIVAYCRGPYCVLAIQAVEFLRKKGFRALRLEDGVQEWQAQGLPLAAGEEG